MGSIYIPTPQGQLFPLNVNNRLFPPNDFDNCLRDEYGAWTFIQSRGGLKAFCPGLRYNEPPHLKMPLQGKRYSEIHSIPLPAANGLDTLIGSFIVPTGFDGVGTVAIFNYTGAGFVEGSGDLTWRLELNQHFVKNFGNVPTQIGSLKIPYAAASNNAQILLQSNQLVQLWVNRSVASAGNLNGGRIIGSLWGWYFPRS